jgi:hypothetical protein
MTTAPNPFPVRKAPASGANEPRHDRGADNRRLTVSESEPVSFAVVITRRPAVDQMPCPTDRGEGMPQPSRDPRRRK